MDEEIDAGRYFEGFLVRLGGVYEENHWDLRILVSKSRSLSAISGSRKSSSALIAR